MPPSPTPGREIIQALAYWIVALLGFAVLLILGPLDPRRELYCALLLPLLLPLAHLDCGLAQLLLTRSLSQSLALLRGTLLAYGPRASARHLASALRVALGEEVLFRGLLLLVLGRWLDQQLLALGLSSVLFALAHLPRVPAGRRVARFVDYALLGLLLGGLALGTDALLPAVLLHGARNYLLRCILVSREELAQRRAEALLRSLEKRKGGGAN